MTNGCTTQITNRKVAGFEWDLGNREKCQKHGVPIAVVESMFLGPISVFPDPMHSGEEVRFKAVGTSDEGRDILVVFT